MNEETPKSIPIHLSTDHVTGRLERHINIYRADATDAAKAHTAKEGLELDGRPINVDFAKQKDPHEKQELVVRSMTTN